jgi:hypothetical protein
MRIATIALLAAGVAGCASIPHTSPAQMETAFQVALAADMLTTLDIKNHSDIQESNFILGPHPSDTKVLCYWAASGLLHYAISKEIHDNADREVLNFWEYATTTMELAYFGHNLGIGLKVRF